MKVTTIIDEQDLKAMVLERLNRLMPEARITEKDITFEVKASMNFKSEWEVGRFRATVNYQSK